MANLTNDLYEKAKQLLLDRKAKGGRPNKGFVIYGPTARSCAAGTQRKATTIPRTRARARLLWLVARPYAKPMPPVHAARARRRNDRLHGGNPNPKLSYSRKPRKYGVFLWG